MSKTSQIAKVGWPTVGKWLSTWSALCRHIYRPAVGSANRHAVATTVGTRLAQQRYRQTNCWPIAGMFACPTMGQRSILVRFLLVYISARYWERKAALSQCNGWQMVGPSLLS